MLKYVKIEQKTIYSTLIVSLKHSIFTVDYNSVCISIILNHNDKHTNKNIVLMVNLNDNIFFWTAEFDLLFPIPKYPTCSSTKLCLVSFGWKQCFEILQWPCYINEFPIFARTCCIFLSCWTEGNESELKRNGGSSAEKWAFADTRNRL